MEIFWGNFNASFNRKYFLYKKDLLLKKQASDGRFSG